MSHRAFIWPKGIEAACKELWKWYRKDVPGARKRDVLQSLTYCHMCEEWMLADETWPPISANELGLEVGQGTYGDLERYSCDKLHCENCAKECISDMIQGERQAREDEADFFHAIGWSHTVAESRRRSW